MITLGVAKQQHMANRDAAKAANEREVFKLPPLAPHCRDVQERRAHANIAALPDHSEACLMWRDGPE
jgi:hypothetical protein